MAPAAARSRLQKSSAAGGGAEEAPENSAHCHASHGRKAQGNPARRHATRSGGPLRRRPHLVAMRLSAEPQLASELILLP